MIGVTGASGFIGAHLLAQLGDSGFNVDLRALDTPTALADYLNTRGCHTVVHLAGPLPGDSDADGVTTELAQRVAAAVMSLDECHTIFSSSIRVHSREEGVFTADSLVAPFDTYGSGKAAAETVFLGCADAAHPVSILRMSSVQGISIDGHARGLIGVFVRQSASGGPITIMGTGESIKDLVGVDSTLDAIGNCILQPPLKSPHSQIIPVGSGKPTSVNELAAVISKLSGVDIVHIDPDPNDLSGYVDCGATGEDLQNIIENIWRAVKTELGVS